MSVWVVFCSCGMWLSSCDSGVCDIGVWMVIVVMYVLLLLSIGVVM